MNQPLVSILIPVEGHDTYLELALTSVLLQTYTNIEIIIRDPTPTAKIKNLIEKEFLPYSNRITYIKDTRYMSSKEIFQYLLSVANGTYINFLMEKDLFYPTKIEKMMNYFSGDSTNSVKLVTSNIEYIDEYGHLLNTTNQLCTEDLKWDSTISSNLILKHENYVGGLSAPLFRKEDLNQSFGYFAGHHFIKEIELASWLTLTSKGVLVKIAEELLFERKNSNIRNNKVELDVITDWINFIKLNRQNTYILSKTTENYIIKKVSNWIESLESINKSFLNKEEIEKIQEYKEYLS
ncbi:glycosyltransferase [Bacillus cereus]|uniref:glycosyltransferase n=1 Tax=Bacillus cereus TaxID=1396 RepID=UPI0039803943